ncbi:CBO0543 family protein [Geobacillus stearothermophilus]|uniref:CBO0543 family protein n=1 Tax=Geobacillus TaxID=129337 RepID=UPI003307C170
MWHKGYPVCFFLHGNYCYENCSSTVYFISGLTGAFLCFVFVSIGFYSFPARLIPMSPIPIIEMFTVIPFYVLFGVRYSPSKWGWKIPFYWGMVHIAMLLEIFVLFPQLR